MEFSLDKGFLREKKLNRKEYFSDAYFSLPQLCSLSHQIHLIHSMKPKNILEIGIGNGFVSTFLKEAGFEVTTVDINPSLKPDIVAPINNLNNKIKDKFDLVVCCEVLEHMPFNLFNESLKVISTLGENCLITLPRYQRRWGFNGLLDLPKMNIKGFNINFFIPFRKKSLQDTAHFWEIGSSQETSKSEIIRRIKIQYTTVHDGVFHLNPYHLFFIGRH